MNNLIGQLDANQHKDDGFQARQCGFPGDFAYQLQLDDIDTYWVPIAEERLDAVIKDCLILRDQYMHEEATEPSVMTKLQRGLDENFIKDLCRTPDYRGWVIEGYNYLLELAGHPSAIIDFDLEFLY
jgi:hypothetical protein